MENISYVGLSQQLALEQQISMTANNLANVNTPGFKSQKALFIDYLNKPKGGDGILQALNANSYRDLAPGAMAQTYNRFDVALEGQGYFAVQTPDGVRYTRDGSFALNVNGEIVTKSGYAVLSDGGASIVVPSEVKDVQITKEGEVSGGGSAFGRLKVVDFAAPQKMNRIGENLYDALGQAETPTARTRVVQGAVEGSNVNPVLEMNRMIELLRLFQASQKMLQNDHERIRNTIQKLTKA